MTEGYLEKVLFPNGPRDVRVTEYVSQGGRLTPNWDSILPGWQVDEVAGDVQGCRYIANRTFF